MDGGEHDFRMNQRGAAHVCVLLRDRINFDDGHHPRELAELGLVVRVAGYAESDASGVPMAALLALVPRR